MNYDVLHNFISPVTGRIIVGTKDYIIIGGNNGVGIPSPILIDLRLDFMNLRRDYNYARSASIVIGFPNLQFPNAQVLSNLEDGMLVTTKGILSTTKHIISELPDLANKNIWIGNDQNRPIASPIILNDNLPALAENYIWLGNSNSRPTAVTKIVMNNLPDLTTNFFWIGGLNNRPIQVASLPIELAPSLKYNYLWIGDSNNKPVESPLILPENLPALTTGYIWIGDTNSRPVPVSKIVMSNLPDLTEHYLWLGNSSDRPVASSMILNSNLPNLSFGHLWLGNITNRPQAVERIRLGNLPTFFNETNPPYFGAYSLWTGSSNPLNLGDPVVTTTLNIVNLPNLTTGAIWRGDALGRPVENFALTTLEDVTIPEINSEITIIQSDIVLINGTITELTIAIAAIGFDLVIINSTLIAHSVQISEINSRIDNLGIKLVGDVTAEGKLDEDIETTLTLTLDQIKIAQNSVDLNNQKITNVQADNVEAQDAINAKFLWDLMHDEVQILWQ